MQKKAKKRVILGMSAGVDSSVAAALLKDQGYEVIGVFLHFWKEPGQDALRENKCCSLESQEDARKVASKLGIRLYTVNAAREFKKEIVDYFLQESKAGRTPNPCVVCNERIKFNFLFKKMLEMKADFVSSGHYATIEKMGGKYHLFTSSDEDKDQTYFLYGLTQKQLGKILFPVGKYKKPEIRKIAKEINLDVFDKEDSQGLCFTPEKSPTEFLKRNLKLKVGKIIDTEGKIVGEHEGLELYTIGQRKGIQIGGDGPYFVVERNFKNNQLVVTNNQENPLIFRKKMEVEMKNWICKEPKFPFETNVKIRYRHPLVRAIIKEKSKNKFGKDILKIEFLTSQKAVTSGQSAVFYSDEKEVLGGGIIK
jgi:tRNA-specific 2-thiouridylase